MTLLVADVLSIIALVGSGASVGLVLFFKNVSCSSSCTHKAEGEETPRRFSFGHKKEKKSSNEDVAEN